MINFTIIIMSMVILMLMIILMFIIFIITNSITSDAEPFIIHSVGL